MHRISVVLTVLVLFAVTLPTFAHDEVRVIGTIVKKQKASIQVKTKSGKSFSIALDKDTTILRGKKEVAVSELKTGITVVVDALGDSDVDLVAQEVQIVPAITSNTSK
jgi:biopolymer transport protein ExbD